jgi:NTP pyrophosphatase (non-canonical NTP hydrolase)
MNQLSFEGLRQANDERAKVWNTSGTPLSVEFAVIELLGEAGELANAMKKHLRAERGLKGGVPGMGDVVDELADVVICCDLLARRIGVDLGQAVVEKFNRTSDKHGFPVKL